MGRLSRGCLRCRERRVRCDEGRPSCQRCIKRNEICEGYRDEASLIFRHETRKVIEHAHASAASSTSSSTPNSLRRSRSVEASPSTSYSSVSREASDLSELEGLSIGVQISKPWLKQHLAQTQTSVEDHAVDQFMEKFVIFPCNETSSPGFLEHLPSLFKDVNVEGRFALRWAVKAAAYADLSKDVDNASLAQKAFHCYGMALSALGESLAEPGKAPDDYDLMTVVILDIFETLFLPNTSTKGTHAQGMAQILRLRGSAQVHNPRGWSLFRLAYHRIQKQQLALGMPIIAESHEWLEQLSDNLASVRIEKDAFKIKQTCDRAQMLLDLMISQQLAPSKLLAFAQEMLAIDKDAATWRQSSEWAFRVLLASDLPQLDSAITYSLAIQLHPDIWNAYEWNYHRTARIILHQQLLKCLQEALDSGDLEVAFSYDIWELIQTSTATVHQLADEVLSTVPQTFGDIDRLGIVFKNTKGPPRFRAIGSYLLLWPIKTIKSEASWTTQNQKLNAQNVFERIREYTGMKYYLGIASCI